MAKQNFKFTFLYTFSYTIHWLHVLPFIRTVTSYSSPYISYGTDKENLLDSQELLQLVISSFIIMT